MSLQGVPVPVAVTSVVVLEEAWGTAAGDPESAASVRETRAVRR